MEIHPGLGVEFVVQVAPASVEMQYGSPVAKGIANILAPSVEQAIAPHSTVGMFSGAHVFPESFDRYKGSFPALPARHSVPSPDIASVNQLLAGALPGVQVFPKLVEL